MPTIIDTPEDLVVTASRNVQSAAAQTSNAMYTTSNINHKNLFAQNYLKYDDSIRLPKDQYPTYDPFEYDDPELNLLYEDDEEYDNEISAGRNFPPTFGLPKFQTNFFEADYTTDYHTNNQGNHIQVVQKFV